MDYACARDDRFRGKQLPMPCQLLASGATTFARRTKLATSSCSARACGSTPAARMASSSQTLSSALRRVLRRWPKRSEEHTSELQSLMRISYAVFRLTKQHNICILQTYTKP